MIKFLASLAALCASPGGGGKSGAEPCLKQSFPRPRCASCPLIGKQPPHARTSSAANAEAVEPAIEDEADAQPGFMIGDVPR